METTFLYLIFPGLPPNQIKQIGGLAIQRNYSRGQFIFLQGEVWPYLFFVAEGMLSAVKESVEGRSLVMGKFSRGDVFWGMSFFNPTLASPVTLQAIEESQLLLWDREGLLPHLLANGRAAWGLCNLLVDRMHKASLKVEELAFQPVVCRLARLLLENFKNAPDGCVARNLTLDEMAAHIGTTREMVCRALYKLADEKIIQVTRTEFYLSDHIGLSRLVGQL